MTKMTVQVPEWMADFIGWAEAKGQDSVRAMVREYVNKLRKENDVSQESRITEGFKWDPVLEPNDDVDQWKHGGDCNLCRKIGYCMTKCRANKTLQRITTPFLYQQYLEENPDAAAKRKIEGIDPQTILNMVNAQ